MKIYLDFDGTVVEHEYPYIGNYNDGCFEVIKKLQEANHEIILNTYRANCHDGTLEEALKYLNKSDKIYAIWNYTKSKIQPGVWDWEIHKLENTIFIDDIAIGIPTIELMKFHKKVDWHEIDKQFIANKIY